MFWSDVLEIFLLIYAPCVITQFILLLIPFGVLYGIFKMVKKLGPPNE